MDSLGWLNFSNICEKEFHRCDFQALLIQECLGNADIAHAVFYHLGGDSIAWLYQSIAALDGHSALNLIRQGEANQVRECLWRMP